MSRGAYSSTATDERVERANFYGRADIWILTIHVHADRRRQRDRAIVIRGVASQHRVDVVPAQILYNDLAACHTVAQYRNPVGDEFVVAIPGHRRGRLTYGNTSISFQLAACQLGGKIIAPGIDETRRFAEVFSVRMRAYRDARVLTEFIDISIRSINSQLLRDTAVDLMVRVSRLLAVLVQKHEIVKCNNYGI